MKRKQTHCSDSSKAAKRVLRSNTTLEINIAEKEREMTIVAGLLNDGSSIRVPPKELGFHLKQCISASLIAKYFVILFFRAQKRVDAGGPCLGVNGRSVLSNKSLSQCG